MKIATTTGDFAHYADNDIERIQALYAAGFRYVDLDMYTFTPASVYMSDGWRDAVQALKREADALGMKFVQAHSQGGNPLDGDADKVKFILDATVRSIEICHELGIPNTVVHCGFGKGLDRDGWFEKNREFYKKLYPAMEKHGVNVLIENSTRSNMGDMYFCNNGRDMRDFLEYLDHPMMHACWDTGHGNCEGGQYGEIMTLGDELYAIHYNDNHGQRDEHLMPYLGTLNHDEIMNALIDSRYKGYFTLEASSSLIKKNHWPYKRREYSGDERLCNPAAFMQRELVALMYRTTEYMLKAYDVFEE